MAWTEGVIKTLGNYHNSTATPLDGKTVVANNAELEDITAPYDGLIVHVADSATDRKTYVCINAAGVPTSAPSGVIVDTVWKEVGSGGGSDVLSLPDQSSDPASAADTTTLYSTDEVDSSPDFLYLLNEASGTAAVDSGQLGVDGVKAGGVGIAASGIVTGTFGNCAVFDGVNDSISVGAVAGAPFYFNSNSSGRGDFEMVFRFKVDTPDKTLSLLSTNPTPVVSTTAGHYAVLVVTNAGAGNGRIKFEYTSGLNSSTAEWTLAATEQFSTISNHLVISFMTDVNTYAGNSAGVGKLRCFLDGVALDDAANAGTKEIAATLSDLGKVSPPAPSGDALYNFTSGSELDDEVGSATASISQGPEDSGAQYVSGSTGGTGWTGFGQQLRINNATIQKYPASNANRLTIPNPVLGTGSFTFEMFYNPDATSGDDHTVWSIGRDTTYNSSVQFWIRYGTTAWLRDTDSSGNSITFKWDGNGTNKFLYNAHNGAATHYAFVREVTGGSATWRVYLNGIHLPHDSVSGSGTAGQVTDYVGDMQLGTQYWFSNTYSYSLAAKTGYYDSVRITKSALYPTGNISGVPNAPFGVPSPYYPLNLGQYLDGNVSSIGDMLYRFDSNATDEFSATTATINGTPHSSRPQYKTGGNSPYGGLGAAFGDQIWVSPIASGAYDWSPGTHKNHVILNSLAIGTGPFTMEFFADFTGNSNQSCFISNNTTTSSANRWFITPEGATDKLTITQQIGNTAHILRLLVPYNTNSGTMKHYVIVRSVSSGGISTWRMYVDGAHCDYNYGSPTSSYAMPTLDFSNYPIVIGKTAGGNTSYRRVCNSIVMDEFRLTLSDTLYTGTTANSFVPPTGPHEGGVPEPFDGNMDEFAVYNDRCLHDTNDTFQVPAEPIRATALSVPTILDSEGTKSKLLTTSNAGLLLPKSIEGLSDGSPWNDGGTVRIVPSVGPGVTGISLGGTGQITRQAGLDALTGTGTATHVLTHDGTNAGWAAASAGDVTGPGSSVDNRIVTFDGTTGKVIQDSTKLLSDYSLSGHNHSGVYAPNSHTHASSDLSSAVPLTLGGTGATTRPAALNAITGTGTTGHVLTWDGTNADWAAASGGSSEWGETSTILHPADSSGAQTVVIGGTTTSNSDIVLNANGSAVFNVQSAAVDFLIKGDNDAELFFVDGSADKIGIGTNAPNELVTMEGALSLKEISVPSHTADHAKLYAKDVSGTTKLFAKDSAGTEIELGAGGGGGGLNFSAGTSAPGSPVVGDFWYETSANVLYMRIEDVDTPPNEVWLDISTVGGTSISSSGTAPSNPSLGDFWYDTTNNILYVRVEDSTPTAVWLDISTAGGGGSNWSSNIEAATLDGVVALKKQSSVPSATADYAKIYSRNPLVNAKVLYHFEDNLNDSTVPANNGSTGAGTPTYAASTIGGARGIEFGKAIDFNGSTYTTFADPGIGVGDFTIEFFIKLDNANGTTSSILSYANSGSSGVAGYFQIHRYQSVWYIAFWNTATPGLEYVIAHDDTTQNEALVNNVWYHLAIVRDGTNLYFYKDGVRKVFITGAATPDHFIGGALPWSIGATGPQSSNRLNGAIDELLITTDAKYTGPTYTVPTSPYSATATKLFIMDGDGNEIQLSP